MRRILLGGLIVAVVSAACQSPSGRWSSADAAASNRMRCCTGRITYLGATVDGGRELRLLPRADSADLLAAGQSELICHVPASRLTRFVEILAKLSVGDDCQICGWFVRDDTTNLHQLRPLTSIDPYPDR